MIEAIACTVYKSRRQADLYLYLRNDLSLQALPPSLRELLGLVEPVMALTLTPQRKLARETVTQVMSALRQHGYFLQMPPAQGSVGERAGPPIHFPETLHG